MNLNFKLNELYQKTKEMCIYNREVFNNIYHNFVDTINKLK
jgi:hypothetical protein